MCYLRHHLHCACQYLPHYQQCLPTWGHPWCQGQSPCGQAPTVTEPKHPWRRGCYMKMFPGKRNGDCSKNQEFTSLKPPVPAPAIPVPVGLWLFLTVPLKEMSYSETVFVLISWAVRTMWVSCVNIFSAGTFGDVAIELSGSPDLHHLYFQR